MYHYYQGTRKRERAWLYVAFEIDLELVEKVQVRLSRTPVLWVKRGWGGAPLG